MALGFIITGIGILLSLIALGLAIATRRPLKLGVDAKYVPSIVGGKYDDNLADFKVSVTNTGNKDTIVQKISFEYLSQPNHIKWRQHFGLPKAGSVLKIGDTKRFDFKKLAENTINKDLGHYKGKLYVVIRHAHGKRREPILFPSTK
ncbi:MAG: hypothetical protein ACI9BD_000852 [Candidatus Marinamargulisbacteria bacterium]|jgi:hypothetical protein